MPYEAQELEWGEQTTKLQHVEQTMREVGRILSHKLDSLWDHEIFHYHEHAESSFARGLKSPVVLWIKVLNKVLKKVIKVLKNLAVFWAFTGYFRNKIFRGENRTNLWCFILVLALANTQPWKGYGQGCLSPGFFWKNSSKDILKFFAL